MREFQIAIIGGGVVGCALARELAQYNCSVAVFEKGSDVASGASKANSGVVHSGINSAVGSLKARFCVEGNRVIESIANDLGISAQRVGKFVIAKNEKERKELEQLKQVGERNGVMGLEIIDGSEVIKKEPEIKCSAGLWVPSAGILLPYELTIAFADHASINGVSFFLNTTVTSLQKKSNGFCIGSSNGEFFSHIVVNAAGVQCHEVASFIEKPDFQVFPCRGEYLILDKRFSHLIHSMIYPVPDKKRGVLGVHITPTLEGNILLGPSAEFVENGEDTRTTRETMQMLLSEAKEIIPRLPIKEVITGYAGIRCKLASEKQGGWKDYLIQESNENPGFIQLLGIESPGLTAAPAIAQYVTTLISNKITLKQKKDFKKTLPKRPRFSEMTQEQQKVFVKKDPRWGRIICRCEHVTEAEVLQALKNPLGAQTLTAVKYRCRAGMGRCQGGFCTQHIVRLMCEELGLKPEDIRLKSINSHLFTGKTREDSDEIRC